ncbi:MAG: MFS transporter, partial [Chloroflexota bacterium]
IFFIPLLSGFYNILFLMIILNIFMAPVSSLADNATITMLGDEKNLYGRLRLGGTIGFAIAAPFAGMLVQKFGLISAFWGAALMYFLAFLISRKFVYNKQVLNIKSNGSFLHDLSALLKNSKWLFFLIAALAGGFAMSAANNYFLALMKDLGASESVMGLALSLGTLCEIPLLFFGNVILKYIKAYNLFLIALLISGIRLILFSLVITTNQALFVQFFNGMTFPLFWMAGVAFIGEHAPEGMNATAQGIFSAAVFGIGTSFGGYMGGSLLGSIGARGMFQVFGLSTTIIVVIIFLSQKLMSRNQNIQMR